MKKSNLDQFIDNGCVALERVLLVPVTDRLPGLIERYGRIELHVLVAKMLREFSDSFNLIRPMSEDQCIEIASELLETSYEDNLAIEDFALFFDGAKKAKYGPVLDRLDQQTIFALLQEYRRQRICSIKNNGYKLKKLHNGNQ